MNSEWISTPIVGAIIGYTTNWLAIKMLFRPYNEVKIFGKRLPFTPGLIPKERARVAKSFGEVVENYLLTEEALLESLTGDQVEKMIIAEVEKKLFVAPNQINFSALLGLKEQEVEPIIAIVHDKIMLICQEILVDLSEKMVGEQSKVQITQMIVDKIEKMDALEEIISPTVIAELRGVLAFNEPKMKQVIIELLNQETVEKTIKEMIGQVVSEKFGALGAMFANTDNIYLGIKEVVLLKLDQMEMAQFVESQIMKLASQPILSMVPMNSQKNIINVFVQSILEGETLSRITETTLLPMISEKVRATLEQFICEPITLSEHAKRLIDSKIKSIYDVLIQEHVVKLIRAANISQITEKQINKLEIKTLEKMLLDITSKELSAITWLGGLLGFVMSIILLVFQKA